MNINENRETPHSLLGSAGNRGEKLIVSFLSRTGDTKLFAAVCCVAVCGRNDGHTDADALK